MALISVRHDSLDRFTIDVRGHEIVVDQPQSGDTGPTPTELWVASLAACAAFYARRFLARHGLDDGQLTVTSDFVWAADHSRVDAISLRVESAAGIPEELHEALRRVLARCTVQASLDQAPTITKEIVSTIAV